MPSFETARAEGIPQSELDELKLLRAKDQNRVASQKSRGRRRLQVLAQEQELVIETEENRKLKQKLKQVQEERKDVKLKLTQMEEERRLVTFETAHG